MTQVAVTAMELEAARRRENVLDDRAAMAAPERQIILDALESNNWNRQNTAATLGINRTTLYKKMKKYGIEYEPALSRRG